jgi:hypothetical protein
MTTKELYMLSVKLSGGVCRKFFRAPDGSFHEMESTADRKAARKYVYELLAPLLLKD